MASTIRHNRARGKHQVDLMSELVVKFIKLGWTDLQIAAHLQMDAEEILRLKQQTGFAELKVDGTPAALTLFWSREKDQWKIIAYSIEVP